MRLNVPHTPSPGQVGALPTRGCGQVAVFATVYGTCGGHNDQVFAARAGAGSLNLSTDIVGRLFIALLNRIHSLHPISLKKNSFAKKPEKMRIASLFSPIFRHMGRALEGAVIVVIKIQIAAANAAKGFW